LKFSTKLWKRTERSFAVTVPNVALVGIDTSIPNDVIWTQDRKTKQWSVKISDEKTSGAKTKTDSKKQVNIQTKLWKRSQRAYATTIPHSLLLTINERKEHQIEWAYDEKAQAWRVQISEVRT
jgi:hypothetical protein